MSTSSDERKFLHDIAGPISNATLLLATLLRHMEKNKIQDKTLDEGIKELGEILGEMRILLDRRRDLLISRGQ